MYRYTNVPSALNPTADVRRALVAEWAFRAMQNKLKLKRWRWRHWQQEVQTGLWWCLRWGRAEAAFGWIQETGNRRSVLCHCVWQEPGIIRREHVFTFNLVSVDFYDFCAFRAICEDDMSLAYMEQYKHWSCRRQSTGPFMGVMTAHARLLWNRSCLCKNSTHTKHITGAKRRQRARVTARFTTLHIRTR
jgi:hypothetical protein